MLANLDLETNHATTKGVLTMRGGVSEETISTKLKAAKVVTVRPV